MTGTTRRAHGLSSGQAVLAAVIALLAAAVTPVFFIVMFVTVNGLLGPYFDGWAWTVPVATEIVFALMFLLAVLFEWLRCPSVALWLAPYPFAVISAFLNVWAYHGSVPGMTGHLAVTLAFFTPVTFAKMGVRRLLVTDGERARALFAGAVVLGCVGLLAALARHNWHRMLAPTICAALLLAGGLGMNFMAPQALQWQAQTAEQQGQYAHAIALFQRAGSASGVARTELEWGQTLITQNDFTDAQTQIQSALDASQGALHEAARAAIGQLLWRWGQVLQVHGDLANTRAKWEATAALAANTPAGMLATTALAVPQTVTGHMLWLGAPVPSLRVALVTAWKFTNQFHILQVDGERLETVTGDDGTFTIHGVRPGVAYTLIWEGALGDTTKVDVNNQPLYTVTLEPLQGSDMGAVTIDTTSSVSHNSHSASGNSN